MPSRRPFPPATPRRAALLLGALLLAPAPAAAQSAPAPAPALAAPGAPASAPLTYDCYRAPRAPRLDGSLDDAAWRAAPFSPAFVDIEGDRKSAPRFRTRMKLLWDDRYLYVGAELQEPDVWGTLTRRDAVIFHDNDFEMFIDPDGDALNYVELEINALNTVWDLFLAKPYRDGGHADNAFDIAGLRTGVRVLGTLNRPGDVDSGWTVTMALPWRALARASGTTSAPQPGQAWRINFSRVEWRTDVVDGGYRKVPGLKEDNWVWSPQGLIDMHQPEHWGTVRFSATRADRRPAQPAADTAAARPAQAPRPDLVLSGYLADVGGAHIAYHSPDPEAETALLARARREVQSVTWLTDTVPADTTADTVAFVWLAGLAGSKGLHRFDFAVNGRRVLSFTSVRDSAARDWTVTGEGGASLSFRTTLVDQFQDVFGYATLRLPRRALAPGAPLALTVTGADAGSSDWYMTFRHRLAAHPRVTQDPVLVRAGDAAEAQVHVILDNLGAYREAEVEAAGHAPVRMPLHFGVNVLRTLAGPVPAPRTERVVVRLDGRTELDTAVGLVPVPQRDVYLLPYSHNDIGYSDLQERVRLKQWRNIDAALDLIDRTRDYPADARFRWNVEVLWPVASWLAQASPADRARFVAAVREGSLGLNAFQAGVLGGLATAPEMTHFFDAARTLRDRDSLPITTALISDIPGQSWGIVTALAGSGIHAFAMAPNNGDRIGFVLQDWGDRPFRWVSQSGQDTVVTWVAGASYSLFHEARIRVAGEKQIFALMRRLDAMHYPYVPVQLPYTVDGDNGPTDPDLPDYVREWDARYASPRLVIATHAQLFRALAPVAAQLPVVAGDFTGYWEDGAASTARETALARAASSRLVQAEALCAMRGAGACRPDEDAAAWLDVAMWDEHTWGAAASIDTPDAPDVVAQWRYKQAFALGADSLSRDLLAHGLAMRGEVGVNAFDVYNTSSWPRTDLVEVPAAWSAAGDRVVGPDLRAVPSQRLASGALAVLVRDVPPFAGRRYRVVRGRALAPAGSGARADGATLRTRELAVALDSATGGVAGVLWNPRDVDLVDASRGRTLGGYLYVAGRDSSAAAGPSHVTWRVTDAGPLVASAVSTAAAPGARSLVREVRLVAGLDRVDLRVTIDKTPVRSPEGVHLAFPLRVRGGEVRYDVASSVVRADADQLRGAARNFVEAQSWVDVSNDSVGVTVAVPDAPLVEIGGINAESPWMRAIPPSQTVYSYVMNNYWHTNYKAEQEGPVTFRYVLHPHGPFRPADAARDGAEARAPLLVVPAAGRAPAPSLVVVAPAAVLVTALRPAADGRSWLVALWNPTAAAQRATVRWRGGRRLTLAPGDAAGGWSAGPGGALTLPAHGTATVRVAPR